MGKGDKRSFKGKLFRHSHGKTRPRYKKKQTGGSTTTAAAAPRKK